MLAGRWLAGIHNMSQNLHKLLAPRPCKGWGALTIILLEYEVLHLNQLTPSLHTHASTTIYLSVRLLPFWLKLRSPTLQNL